MRRLDLSLERVHEILQAEATEHESAAADMDRLGHSEVAQELRASAAIARRYLEG